jgi:cytochrome c-type biogenesis protein CcmH/NrfF
MGQVATTASLNQVWGVLTMVVVTMRRTGVVALAMDASRVGATVMIADTTKVQAVAPLKLEVTMMLFEEDTRCNYDYNNNLSNSNSTGNNTLSNANNTSIRSMDSSSSIIDYSSRRADMTSRISRLTRTSAKRAGTILSRIGTDSC